MTTLKELLEEMEEGLEGLTDKVEKLASRKKDEFSGTPTVFIPGEESKDGSRRFYHPNHPKVKRRK